MLPHNHNGAVTLLISFKRSNLNKETTNSLRMISYEIETCRSALNVFNTNLEDWIHLCMKNYISWCELNLIFRVCSRLTLNLLTTTIVAPPSNASKWQMRFNSAFKGLIDRYRNLTFNDDILPPKMFGVCVTGHFNWTLQQCWNVLKLN